MNSNIINGWDGAVAILKIYYINFSGDNNDIMDINLGQVACSEYMA
jgi:hypothetical protein